MKKIVFLAAALMASMFILTSCEKENVAEMAEINAKGCNFVIAEKNIHDEYGNIGDLYVDLNNPDNAYFQITSQTRASENKHEIVGKWTRIVVREKVESQYCDKTNPVDCYDVVVNGRPMFGVIKDATPLDK